MAKNGFKIIDSDMHIMEPPDLWERYIDKKFRDRAPRGVISHNVRDLRMVYPDGRDWARQSPRESDVASGHNFRQESKHLPSRRRARLDAPKCSSKRWISKASTSRFFIRPAVCAPWWSTIWMRPSPPPWRAPTTIGSMIFARKIRRA